MRHFIFLTTLFLCGCNSSYTVTQHGQMSDALCEGNTQPQITFKEALSKPHAFGVGALSNLDGEVTIFNSVIYTATTSDGKTTNTKVDDATYDSATLLTLAHVDSWSSMELPTMKPPSLENAIELAAVLKGVDTETPFPFFISGNTNYFHIHVINGFCPVANPDLETQYLPWKLESSNTQEITVVGFYAKGQEGVMTHHGSPIHIHGIMTLNGELTTGHLDSVALNEGATIFLPSN